MAMDISTVGAKITFKGFGFKGHDLVVSEFSDEGTPFDAPDIDASDNKKNLNGTMISSRTPSVYPFSITLIPGSLADVALARVLARSSIQPGGVEMASELYGTITVAIPNSYVRIDGSHNSLDNQPNGGARSYTYTNARIKSGPTGPTSSAEGRMGARTYTFEAEGFRVESGGTLARVANS